MEFSENKSSKGSLNSGAGLDSDFRAGFGSDGKRQEARILVVDDIAANVELLEVLLSFQGYQVSMAFDGEQALQKVKEDDPDLVLLDVMMPGMNGFEVCRRLKLDENTRMIPVVLLTALDQLEDKIRGLDVGADDFLSKPFKKVELLARVRSLLRIRQMHTEIDQKSNLLYRLLNRYLSEEIVTEILANPEERLKLGGEKKEVAVLFADIRGFTAFAETTSAEHVVEVLNECFQGLTEAVFRNQGTFDKYVGDCVLAFYGAPISYGNDLQRALKTAVEMQEIFHSISQNWTDPRMQTLGLGIGLHYGEVVVGNIGSVRQMDYTVIGDTVNVAQRLEQVAQKGQILISPQARNQAREFIRTIQLPPVAVKGKREPITPYLLEELTGVEAP